MIESIALLIFAGVCLLMAIAFLNKNFLTSLICALACTLCYYYATFPTCYVYKNGEYIEIKNYLVVDIVNDKECFIDSEDYSNCKLITVSWTGKSKKTYTILNNKIDRNRYKNKLKIDAIKEN